MLVTVALVAGIAAFLVWRLITPGPQLDVGQVVKGMKPPAKAIRHTYAASPVLPPLRQPAADVAVLSEAASSPVEHSPPGWGNGPATTSIAALKTAHAHATTATAEAFSACSEARTSCLAALTEPFAESVIVLARARVTANGEVALRVGADGVAVLRTQVRQLSNSSGEVIEKHLRQDRLLWPHLFEQPSDAWNNPQVSQAVLKHSLQRLFGSTLWPLLVDAGLETSSTGHTAWSTSGQDMALNQQGWEVVAACFTPVLGLYRAYASALFRWRAAARAEVLAKQGLVQAEAAVLWGD